jgi:hypothetical protein
MCRRAGVRWIRAEGRRERLAALRGKDSGELPTADEVRYKSGRVTERQCIDSARDEAIADVEVGVALLRLEIASVLRRDVVGIVLVPAAVDRVAKV